MNYQFEDISVVTDEASNEAFVTQVSSSSNQALIKQILKGLTARLLIASHPILHSDQS